MATVVTFRFSAAGTQSWTSDADYVLTGCISSGSSNAVVVSVRADRTAAQLNAPSATDIVEDVLLFAPGVSKNMPQVRVPLLKDSTIFVNAAGIVSCVLFLEPAALTDI